MSTFLDKTILALCFLLVFILSIPGTMTLRYTIVLLLLLIIFSMRKLWLNDLKQICSEKSFKLFFLLIGSYVSYVLLHSLFLSHDVANSISEFRSQIIYPVITLFIGVSIALIFSNNGKRKTENLFLSIFYAFLLHVIYINLYAIWFYFSQNEILRRFGGLMESPTYANYVTNIFLGILVAEVIYRLRSKERFLRINNKLLIFSIGLTFFATLIETVRLGDITLAFLAILAAIFFLYKNQSFNRVKKYTIVSVLIFLLITPLFYNIYTDPRWIRLTKTVPIALDTSAQNSFWRDEEILNAPKIDGRSIVGNSNYMRIAWARQSLHYIKKNKLGIGFSRDAFGRTLKENFPLRRNKKDYLGMSSHSGIIDLALGIGLPGVFLWTSIFIFLAKKSFTLFRKQINFSSILLFIFASGFFSRSIVDANIRDHMLLEFMFLLGIIIVIIRNDEEEINVKSQT